MPLSYNMRVLRFSAAVCVVSAVLVSSSAVLLKDRQVINAELDRKKNVLLAAGDLQSDDDPSSEEIEQKFGSFEVIAIDLETGAIDPSFDTTGYDAKRAVSDNSRSRSVPSNPARVLRVPNRVLAYRRLDAAGQLEMLVLPVNGQGLWGAMYGFVALGPDLTTVRGLTYYEHKETPGLGAEVDNPRWRALWPGRRLFDDGGTAVIEVTRGAAGSVADDPHRVDGLAGATITSNAVTNMLRFWLGEHGYGSFLTLLTEENTDG